jgi:hypothetical protein
MKRETITRLGAIAFTLALPLVLTGPAGAGKSSGAPSPPPAGTGQNPGSQSPVPDGAGQDPGAPAPVSSSQGASAPFPQAVEWPEADEPSPILELELSGESPVDVLLDGLYELDPRDIRLRGTQRRPVLLWRGQPVLFADLRDLLYDDEIDLLLETLDSDPDLWEPAADLTDFLHETRFLPRQYDVVGIDLLDQPPVFFVLPF